jgi:hypothetical protein
MFEQELFVHRTGRKLYLTWLHHEWTYGHLYLGRTNMRRNTGTVEHGRRLARRIEAAAVCGLYDPTPQLLASIEPFVLPLSSIARATTTKGDIPLPDLLCVARLDSTAGAREPGAYSSLVVVWFQDGIPLPVSEEAMGTLKELDWETHAADWDP